MSPEPNVLFTEAADKLIALEVSNAILGAGKDLGVDVNWYIPSIVKAERKYQMFTRGKGLLIPLGKLEALLGHNLAFTEEILESRVDEAIARQMSLHSLKEISVDFQQVDWGKIIEDASYRRPPFSLDGEKGFRDAIIIEAISQLAASLPRTPASCRIVILSADKLMREALLECKKNFGNLIIVEDLDALKSLLNAVAAHLPQETAEELVEIASRAYFEDGSSECLHKEWKIQEEIIKKFPNIMNKGPEEGYAANPTNFYIRPTSFVSKSGQKVEFSTSVRVRTVAKRRISKPSTSNANSAFADALLKYSDINKDKPYGAGVLQGLGATYKSDSPPSYINALSSLSEANYEEVKKVGDHLFNVFWRATLTTKGNLSAYVFDRIEFLSTSWID